MEHEKAIETMSIEDYHNDEESLGVLSPQGNISRIHATTLNKKICEQKKPSDAKG